MNRLTMRTMLARRTANRTDLTSDDLDTYLFEGLLDLITRRVEVRQLQAVGATMFVPTNGSTVAYPRGPVANSTVMAIRHLYNLTTGKLIERFPGGLHDYLTQKGSRTEPGEPTNFVEDGGTVYLLPPADIPYTIQPWVYVYPIWTSGDAQEPPIEMGMHRGIVLAATVLTARDVGDTNLAAQAEAELNEWIELRDTSVKRAMRSAVPKRGVQPGFRMTNERLGV